MTDKQVDSDFVGLPADEAESQNTGSGSIVQNEDRRRTVEVQNPKYRTLSATSRDQFNDYGTWTAAEGPEK